MAGNALTRSNPRKLLTESYATQAGEIVSRLGDGPDVSRAVVQISDLMARVGLNASRRVTVLLYILAREDLPTARLEEVVYRAKALQGQMYVDPQVAHQLMEWAQGFSDELEGS
jgi:hypothetical protein